MQHTAATILNTVIFSCNRNSVCITFASVRAPLYLFQAGTVMTVRFKRCKRSLTHFKGNPKRNPNCSSVQKNRYWCGVLPSRQDLGNSLQFLVTSFDKPNFLPAQVKSSPQKTVGICDLLVWSVGFRNNLTWASCRPNLLVKLPCLCCTEVDIGCASRSTEHDFISLWFC